ncbi:MAG: hypothetical protein KKD73_10705 [Proteobacteria bacterium]|nr:hypothetical protein [Pseudomonadota bacterium]
MGYYVSSLVMLQSSKCSSAFACLKTGECVNPAHCQVEEGNNTMVLLKNREPLASCSYRFEADGWQFCTCPTFVALHQQKQDMRRASSYTGRPSLEMYNY